MRKRAASAVTEDSAVQLVDVVEAARRLACGRTQIYQLMDSGRLPWVKIGRCRKIALRDLTEFVEDNRRRGA